MGHYLGELETDDERFVRTVIRPKREALKRYEAEMERGLAHTDGWHKQMREDHRLLEKWDEKNK